MINEKEIIKRMSASANRPFNCVQVFHTAFEGKAKHVASVDVRHCSTDDEALEYAYRWTQNIEDSWSKKGELDGNDKVGVIYGDYDSSVPADKPGHRSTSCSDHMICRGQVYKVEPVGFKPVTKISVARS